MAATTVVIPYAPRKQFLPYHSRAERFACIVAHRRAGKTVAAINEAIKSALTCKNKNPRVAYIAPFYKQAKTVAWTYLKEYALVVPGTTANEAELRIDFPHGGQVRLYGADNVDALRGIYLDDVILDEYADMHPRLWPEVIRPALVDRQGRATFIGTPKGRNAFYDLAMAAQSDKDWLYVCLKASNSGLLPETELAAAKKMMTADQYEQEFECSFDTGRFGGVYSKEIAKMREDGRITRVPYDPSAQVFTAWDLGWGDATSIWFLQFVGRELRWIDYYENNGELLTHYANVVKDKPYHYGKHFLPHDGGAGNIRGVSVQLQLQQLGLQCQVLQRENDLSAARDRLKMMFSYSVIDEANCCDGIKALDSHTFKYDENRKIFSKEPLHDWSSHAADAARYAAQAAEIMRGKIIAKQPAKSIALAGRSPI